MERAQDKIVGIGDTLNSTDSLLRSIGSFWMSITSGMRSSPNTTEHIARRDEWEESHRAQMETYRAAHPIDAPRAPPLPAAGVTDDEDGDLDLIYESIVDMKKKAQLMGEQLEQHNHRLDHLNVETELATERVRKSTVKIEGILGKK